MLSQQPSSLSSSNSLVCIEGSNFKDDIVQKLQRCYNCLDEKRLIQLQKDMILLSFPDVPSSEFESLRSKLMLRYHLIFQECFPDTHFDALESNIVDAMRDCWVDKEVVEQCKCYFGAIRSVLKYSSCMKRKMKVEQDEYVDLMTIGMALQILSAH